MYISFFPPSGKKVLTTTYILQSAKPTTSNIISQRKGPVQYRIRISAIRIGFCMMDLLNPKPGTKKTEALQKKEESRNSTSLFKIRATNTLKPSVLS